MNEEESGGREGEDGSVLLRPLPLTRSRARESEGKRLSSSLLRCCARARAGDKGSAEKERLTPRTLDFLRFF